ncbi:hypothetical protein C5615_38160 [Burkholderia cepacia]|uniref:Oxalate Biosynthetic Component A N-terminal domain-containing protein n=1 Tax=Burkholderia cepacia TaxID=292 RepID=A0A2S8HX39_BURCE|nr:3-keto-5-aminohexanoate cleavage protein [Burkholderia cepacia]PQP07008.1 hypothetical protein C5615_38160 [Burkholderia cepacia]HDR9512162.1 3-keto-5-aminohexanoate cleavage protein [Burkholderia cepacia]
MKCMYITAAPTGAVPKRLDPLDPTFIPSYLIHQLLDITKSEQVIRQLQSDGWEAVPAGGWIISAGHDLSISVEYLVSLSDYENAVRTLKEAGWWCHDLMWHASSPVVCKEVVMRHEWLTDLSSPDIVRQIVLQLTTYGWVANDCGDLVWHRPKLHSYFPVALIDAIRENCPALLEKMAELGWRACGAGYWQPGKGRSPFLPITPGAIIDESLRSLREGAAVVHLHTRELSDLTRLEIPAIGAITVGSQRNQIVVDHYDVIVPAVKMYERSAILNLSTSVRGDREGARSALRRAHLKSYGPTDVPEVASLSPAAVIFRGGGGYDNPPDFLDAQFEHFRCVGTRPEVEVFNQTIVENATTLYRVFLETAGTPVLFMLVAGVDQYYRDPVSGEVSDDSLIHPIVRQEISSCLSTGRDADRQHAIDLAVQQLQPAVARLRSCFPSSLISLLLPGSLQILLADLAEALHLNGVRIGLEDGLNIYDPRVPGGVRKALGTWEQVRFLREELTARGITVQSSAEVREMLGLPSATPVEQCLKRA